MALHYTLTNPTGSNASSLKILAILVHGGALSSSMYRTLIPHMNTPTIAIDLPGHGASVSLGPFTFATSTSHLKSLIESLKSQPEYADYQIALIGISLGGQGVLDFILSHPTLVSTAIVSGAPINPVDDRAQWEMPHMPTDQSWLDTMTKDIEIMGYEAAGALQQESFGFSVKGRVDANASYPPVLVCIGEHDVAMAKRDYEELLGIAKEMNARSEGLVIKGAWHNHSIDIPEEFAEVVNKWVEKTGSGNS